MMKTKPFFIVFLIAIVVIIVCPLAKADVGQVLFSEDFEYGIPGDWSVDNGVWEYCQHGETMPPGGGYLYAATVCGGNYPRYTDSRLISPEIDLTGIVFSSNEDLFLRFWHAFSYAGGDYGYVQIRVKDDSSETWSSWEDIMDAIGYVSSSVWTIVSVDLSKYAGEKVQIAFYHYDNNDYSQSTGWCIDDIELILKAPDLTWDFECGWNDWSAENGLWEIGLPNEGPGKAYSGNQCIGTILDGNYPRYTDSRLVSPPFYLDCQETVQLRFWQWFSYAGGDYGYVQISVYDDLTETWSDWESISNAIGGGESSVWSSKNLDITAYAGEKVKLGFYHYDNNDYSQSTGWYIDHIRIDCDGQSLFPHFCECDLNQDGRCNILDWPKFMQDWGRVDCGTPSGTGYLPNDCECDINKDGKCNIMDWPRFMQSWGNTDCLTCQ